MYQLITLVILVAACSPQVPATSETQFAITSSAKNRALVVTGDKSGGIGEGVEQDAAMLRDALPNFGFGVDTYQADTAEGLHQESARIAKEMLEDPNGTMFWFISTHGSPQGHLSMGNQSDMTTFNNVAAAMREARGNKSFRRLIVFVEACFSGTNVNGNREISNQTGSSGENLGSGDFDYGLTGSSEEQVFEQFLQGLFKGDVQAPVRNPQSPSTPQIPTDGSLSTGLYEELLVIGSSSGDEYSYVRTDGSIAVLSFIEALENLSREKKSTATINDLIESMQRDNQQSQTFQFKKELKSDGNELLFD